MVNNRHGQNGLASIIVVSTIIVTISLLTVGFALIMDRQLRLVTDNELAAQATYSAESGLNDASTYVNQQLAAGNSNPSTNGSCLDTSGATAGVVPPLVKNGSISGDYNNNANDNVDKYTCVLIDARPPTLVYPIDAGKTATFKMIPYDNSGGLLGISNLYFSWQNNNYNSGNPKLGLPGESTSHDLPKESDFNDLTKCPSYNCSGMLEVTIYPIFDDSAGALSNSSGGPNASNQDAAITANARTYFLYAISSGKSGTNAIGSKPYAANGQFIDGDCSSTTPAPPFPTFRFSYCNAEVNNLPGNAKFYYVHIKALYTDQTITVQAANNP